MCTLHEDNRLRLWNTNDGRCIAISSASLLPGNKAVAIGAIEGFPCHLFVFGNAGDLFIVDAYKMQVQQIVPLESHGYTAHEYYAASNTLIFCDAYGAIYLIKDGQA